jgi:hypothetical protein
MRVRNAARHVDILQAHAHTPHNNAYNNTTQQHAHRAKDALPLGRWRVGRRRRRRRVGVHRLRHLLLLLLLEL